MNHYLAGCWIIQFMIKFFVLHNRDIIKTANKDHSQGSAQGTFWVSPERKEKS